MFKSAYMKQLHVYFNIIGRVRYNRVWQIAQVYIVDASDESYLLFSVDSRKLYNYFMANRNTTNQCPIKFK